MRRLAILSAGFALITLLAWASSFATPDALDRRLLLALNPDTPVPVLDAAMIAITDYAIPYVVVLLICGELAAEARLRNWIAAARMPFGFGVLGALLAALAWLRFSASYVHRAVPIVMTPVIAVSFLWVGFRFRRYDEAALLRVRRVCGQTLVSIALAELTLRFVPAMGQGRSRPLNDANVDWNGALRMKRARIF